MRAILYARFSTERQSETSIDDQLRVCRAYAATNGWPVTGEYMDEGISGAALGNRPGARQAIELAQDGNVILVTDLSRLSRSQDLAPLLSRLRHRGVRVIGIQDGYDSANRTARMQAGLSGIMSEEFRAMVADRTHSALEGRARQGQSTGGKAYDNAEVIHEIFNRFAGGDTMREIANDLNRRGVPSPGAGWKARANPRGRWLVSALHALLQNDRYAGRVVWNRSRWVKDPDTGIRVRRERPESEWIVSPCERLIDEVTWARTRTRFAGQAGTRGGVQRYLLSGLLECALCGCKLIVMGGSQHRYTCGAYHAGGEYACSNRLTFPRLAAEEKILDPVVNDMLSPEAIAEGVRAMRVERAAAEHRPVVVNTEVVELERMVRQGLLSRETAAPALEQARRSAAIAEASPVQELPWPSPAAWRETALDMRRILTGPDVLAARGVLKEMLGPVRCTPAAAGDHVIAALTARQVLIATGSGRWIGSGGRI